MPALLIIKTGSAVEPARRRGGDFEQWFSAGVGLTADQTQVINVQLGQSLPDPAAFSGVIITGSSAMVSQREPWSEGVAAWIPRALDSGVLLLGVCYGHQLLAHALGGEVGPNPRGLNMGTVPARLTEAGRQDPLLAGQPDPLPVQVSHSESVLALPPGARLLASCALDPHHAFALGSRAWGIQWHPEFDAATVRCYLRDRRQWVIDHGLDPDALAHATADSPHGEALLRRFGELMA